MKAMEMSLQQAADAAYVLGWRQTNNGHWFHPDYDGPDDPPFESPLQVCSYENVEIVDGKVIAHGRGQP